MSNNNFTIRAKSGDTEVVMEIKPKFTAVLKAVNVIKINAGSNVESGVVNIGLGDILLIGKEFLQLCDVVSATEYVGGTELPMEMNSTTDIFQKYVLGDEDFKISPQLYTEAGQKAFELYSGVDATPIANAKKK